MEKLKVGYKDLLPFETNVAFYNKYGKYDLVPKNFSFF